MVGVNGRKFGRDEEMFKEDFWTIFFLRHSLNIHSTSSRKFLLQVYIFLPFSFFFK
jgi:hypothetical protein